MATNGSHGTNGTSSPDIILYTNHGCPWAHRAHIVIKELGLPYKEEIIDLDRPRDPWYLKVNPVSRSRQRAAPVSNEVHDKSRNQDADFILLGKRGLVPSINYNGEIITESLVVSQFLADAHQSHLIPPSTGAENALFRARANFFADTFTTKALPQIFGGWRAQTDSEKDEAAESLVSILLPSSPC